MPKHHIRFGMVGDDRLPTQLQLVGLQQICFNPDPSPDNVWPLTEPLHVLFNKVARLVPGMRRQTEAAASKVPFKQHVYRCFLVILSMLFAQFKPSSQMNAQAVALIQRWTNIGTALCPFHPNKLLCIKPRKAKPLTTRGGGKLTVARTKNKNNYIIMHLGYDGSNQYVNIDVHRLICYLEHGAPPALGLGANQQEGNHQQGNQSSSGPTHPVAMHLCHNMMCVNPYHIVWGTCRRNIDDTKAFTKNKGAAFRGRVAGNQT
jgi:hypothetical protein